MKRPVRSASVRVAVAMVAAVCGAGACGRFADADSGGAGATDADAAVASDGSSSTVDGGQGSPDGGAHTGDGGATTKVDASFTCPDASYCLDFENASFTGDGPWHADQTTGTLGFDAGLASQWALSSRISTPSNSRARLLVDDATSNATKITVDAAIYVASRAMGVESSDRASFLSIGNTSNPIAFGLVGTGGLCWVVNTETFLHPGGDAMPFALPDRTWVHVSLKAEAVSGGVDVTCSVDGNLVKSGFVSFSGYSLSNPELRIGPYAAQGTVTLETLIDDVVIRIQ